MYVRVGHDVPRSVRELHLCRRGGEGEGHFSVGEVTGPDHHVSGARDVGGDLPSESSADTTGVSSFES